MGKRFGGLLVVAALLLMKCATLQAAEPSATQPSVTDLMQKINDLQAQVQQMKEHQQQQAVSPQEIDATVTRVLQDADRRSQLLQMEGFTAGWDKGRFFIGSSDGNYLLRPWIHLQIRDGTAFRDHAKGGDDDVQNGFELRRARVWVLTAI